MKYSLGTTMFQNNLNLYMKKKGIFTYNTYTSLFFKKEVPMVLPFLFITYMWDISIYLQTMLLITLLITFLFFWLHILKSFVFLRCN